MAATRYVVTWTDAERAQLLGLTTQGRVAARRVTRAHLLWQADAGATQEAMAAARPSGRATVVRLCRRVVEEGLEAALRERSRPGAQRTREGTQAAFLMALAYSPPPAGRQGWTLPWLAHQRGARRVVAASADETGRRTRNKPR